MMNLDTDLKIFSINTEIEHIGFVVQDIKDAMYKYSGLFDIRRWYRTKINKYEVFYHGNSVRVELDIVMGFSGNVQVELINVLSSNGPNSYSETFGIEGEGFHHICTSVKNLDKTLSSIRKEGVDIIQCGNTYLKGGCVGRYAYVDTRRICGCILELLEVRLNGINVKNSQWLLRLGEVIGSVEVLSYRDL